MKKIIVILTTMLMVLMGFMVVTPPAAAEESCASVTWYAEDTLTKGDWYNNPIGSPIGVYGTYAYILPGGETYEAVIGTPVTDFSVPSGFDLQDQSTWSLLSAYGWTGSQINGLIHMYNDPSIQTPPYLDEYWSQSPAVTYSAKGTVIDTPAPRGLVNDENSILYTRETCWFAGTPNQPGALSFTIDLAAGSYQLSLYIMDPNNNRQETIKVELDSTVYAEKNVNYLFTNGLYENFFVYLTSAATITVTLTHTHTVCVNAIISGVFLSTTSETPTTTGVDEIRYVDEDSTTKGNWIGTYGDIGFIKCGWDVVSTTTPANPIYDHSSGITYTTTNAAQYAWGGKTAWLESLQYPVFEWQWHSGFHNTQTQAREVYYPEGDGAGNHWRLACWDDGGERCQPTHGYMDFHLTFPAGTYLLSLYAYDYERTTRASMEYQIYDATGITLLASKQISGAAFDEGIYETFKVVAPSGGCSIILRVYNDGGHPPNTNVLLSGIFVDKLIGEAPAGLTIGFWKTNVGKNLGLQKGKYQVAGSRIEGYLTAISEEYGTNYPFLSGLTMTQAYTILNIPDASVMQDKAEAHILALLLTAEHKGTDYTSAYVELGEVYSGTMQGAINYILGFYGDGYYECAKTYADTLNNLGEE